MLFASSTELRIRTEGFLPSLFDFERAARLRRGFFRNPLIFPVGTKE